MSAQLYLPSTVKDRPKTCPACRAEALIEVTNANIKWCAGCGFHKPPLQLPLPVVTPQLPVALQTWLLERKLKFPLTVLPWEVGSGMFYQDRRWRRCLLLWQMQDGKVSQMVGIGSDETFSGLPPVYRGLGPAKPAEKLVVVGHPLDAMYLRQIGVENVLCPAFPLNDQKSTDQFLQAHEADFKAAQHITLALPSYNEIGRRVGREKSHYLMGLPVDNINPKLPWLLNLARQDKEAVIKQAVDYPMSFPIEGVHSLYDVEQAYDLMYEEGLKPGLSTGWPSVDKCYTIAPGQWSLITGIPGHGKSTWLDGLAVNMAKLHDWRWAVFSPENRPIERHYAVLTEKLVEATFLPGHPNRMTQKEKEEAKPWIADRFKAIMPEEKQSWSLEGILNLVEQAIFRYGVQGVIIDPWNELDHSRPAGLTEHEYLSKCLSMINRFCLRYGVHVFIVAHPIKMLKDADGKYPVPTLYDVSGGAMWRNKTYNGIVISRNFGEIDEDIWDLHVQKIKFKEIGRPGMVSLRVDPYTNVAYDEIDPIKRKKALESPTPTPTNQQLMGSFEVSNRSSFMPPRATEKDILD